MTSPTQLKYLNAMGIPVWVSRELVIEEALSIEPQSSQLSNSESINSLHNDAGVVNSKPNHSAKSILDSLDLDSNKNRDSNRQRLDKNPTTEQTIKESIENSVDSAKLPNVSTTSSINEAHNNENLLFQTPEHFVYASGCKNPDWMVIGHSPEPFNGIGQEPFAGESGELLNNMLLAAGVAQPYNQAYILNVIDKHQDFTADEKNQLETQLALRNDLMSIIRDIEPKIILFVGQKSAQNLLECNDPLIIMRSKVHRLAHLDIPCVVTYYPSYLLQKLTDKRKAWNDLQLAMNVLKELALKDN